MRRMLFSLVVSCLLAPSMQAVEPGGQGLPEVHYWKDPDAKFPQWVALDKVFKPDGALDPSLFAWNAKQSIEDILATPPRGGCVRVGPYTTEIVNPPERWDLKGAVDSARLILLGEVTGRAFGFEGGTPGQLLRLTPEKTLKGSPRNVDHYFVFMPVGDFPLGKAAICKTDIRYPQVPALGEELVVFVPTVWYWDDKDPYLDLLDDAGIVTLKSDDSISLPRRYREHTPAAQLPRTREGLLQLIARNAKVGQ